MHIRNFFIGILFFAFVSCSEDNDVFIPRNLQEYIEANTNREQDNVIACAASADANQSLSYIFYYPIVGATDIRIYETEDVSVDENDFTNYRRKTYIKEDVFEGKLERFNRSSAAEAWCVVTYLSDSKFHKSNPIRLKNATKPTEWTDLVFINQNQTLSPIFSWNNGSYSDSNIYFQVISTEEDNFISGTYTEEKNFQYYNLSNVVLNINTETPEDLVVETTYNFTMMGVSEDNWVNLVIQKSFIAE